MEHFNRRMNTVYSVSLTREEIGLLCEALHTREQAYLEAFHDKESYYFFKMVTGCLINTSGIYSGRNRFKDLKEKIIGIASEIDAEHKSPFIPKDDYAKE